MNFEDHFSKHAETYALYRPHYPGELFAYLAGLTAEHSLAWDCATGNGQAAEDLVCYYDQVIATDASEKQIGQAQPRERITYRVEPAEETSLETNSIDLITVAIAVHWFDFERFYAEVRRVLKPNGVIAVWTYHRPVINPNFDARIAYLEDEILGDYWPEGLKYLQQHYQTVPFPFEELAVPEFFMHADWDLSQILGFINSWSAVRRYEEKWGYHPLKNIWDDFLADWGGPEKKNHICWPLYLRVGRANQVNV